MDRHLSLRRHDHALPPKEKLRRTGGLAAFPSRDGTVTVAASAQGARPTLTLDLGGGV